MTTSSGLTQPGRWWVRSTVSGIGDEGPATAARIAVELLEGLRCKLRLFGIPIDGPCNVYCDNNRVVVNTTHPESTLKKKQNAISYHRVREAVAAGTIRIAKEDMKSNIADLLTKSLPGPRLKDLCTRVLF